MGETDSGAALGTAAAAPGERATGWFEVTDLPTGGDERLPVVLVAGASEGPTAWVTAGVHGDEVTGLAAAVDAAHGVDPDALAGTLVCLPCLNPAGLRRTERTSYYHGEDPNRQFPDPEADRHRPPGVQERIAERVYEAFTERLPADLLLDLHTATVGSMPFLIRDRVLYGALRDRAAAGELNDALGRLVDAVGLPVVREYPREEYVGESLQRSVAGAALNAAGVPACTVELGSHSVVEEPHRAAGVAAVCRALVEWGLLGAVPDWATDAAPAVSAPADYPTRRHRGPRTEQAGIVRHRVGAGDVLEAGDPVADLIAPTGEPLATVTSEHDGYVLGRAEGVAAYENDPLCHLAIRDDGPLVVEREADEDGNDDEGEGEEVPDGR